MARAPGEELFSYVNNQPGGLLPEAEARVIVAELLEALRHSHAHGVLHRDVKLDNVFWDASTGTLSLIDFGLATFFDDRTLLDESVGCINYAGPGLLRLVNQRRPYSPRGGHPDLHAVGVLAHGLLTGYFPFRHEDPLELQAEIASGLPAPVEGASGAANAFLAAVLDPRNEGRITAESLLAHPWFADLAVERAPVRSGAAIPKLPSSAFDARRAAKAVDADLARILPAYLASLDAVADAESSGDESDATLRVERAGSDVSMASVETVAAVLVPAPEPEPAPVHEEKRRARRFDPAKWFGKVRRQRVAAA
ncbi:kinase-like domain-containing protein [Hyaloraphidium curvatum]|nr:kinase-like domain-containing protein [Hyaloraphidium curvatum]